MKPKFSIVIIAKDEATVLPRLFASLEEFKRRGGQVCLLDTGSSDNTRKVASDWGCDVWSVGNEYLLRITQSQAKRINELFVVEGENEIVKEGDKLFDFASARNHISLLAGSNMICTMDADEAYSILDIDKINALIDRGYEQFEYEFIYAHNVYGRPEIQFKQSKFFDRRKVRWTGIVHEVLTGVAKTCYVDSSIILLEHWQELGKEHRSNYLAGLALDCYQNKDKDRQSHYLARELMYQGRYRSAIKEFERHITMGGWPAEKAQSVIYIGKCYGFLNDPEKQAASYSKAFYMDSGRRAALLELALLMRHNDNVHGAAAYAAAALQLPWVDYYANERSHYENLPHEILYWAKGWIGDIKGAQEHILKALQYQPYNAKYLQDTKYYFEYFDAGIEGWMRFPELQWLYEQAKKCKVIVEVGSWKGRSTHALLSGCKQGEVHAVDTWKGSTDLRDATNELAKKENVLEVFKTNIKDVGCLKIHEGESVQVAEGFKDGSVDMVFIDAGHTAEDVKSDIVAWLPKIKAEGLICGHDYDRGTWMTVCEGVDELLKIDGVCDSIWFKKIESDIKTEHQQIPKRIFTAWLSEEEMPLSIQNCISSQKQLEGYEHILITLDNLKEETSGYIADAIRAKKWVKAVDYLRMQMLYNHGGIFMDADTEVLEGKDFNELLDNKMFAGREEEQLPEGVLGYPFIGYSLVGCVPGHPLAEQYLEEVDKRFKGDDNFYFESSMEIFTKLVYMAKPGEVKIYDSEYFFPYNHKLGTINVTDKTISFHHFFKSWNNFEDKLPTVSIILPTLGRKMGLLQCLLSIGKLWYPKHLIEVFVVHGKDKTVPEKIKYGVENTTGEIICYAANDMEFTPGSLYEAILQAKQGFDLVSFNSGKLLPDAGNICEHFIIKRDFIETIGGEIFDTRLHHVGVDNLLWHRAKTKGKATRCKKAIIYHHHFSTDGTWDEVYAQGWKHAEQDRNLLKTLL